MHVNGASSTRIPLGGFCACPVADRVHEARVRRGLQDQNSSPGRSDRDTIPPTRTQKGFGPVCALAPKCGLQDGPERTDSDGGILRNSLLGYLDSNQEQRYQKPPCCQLHHTPRRSSRSRCQGSSLDDARGLGQTERVALTGAERLERAEAPDRLGLAEQLHRLEQRRRDAASADGDAQRAVRDARLEPEPLDQRRRRGPPARRPR